MIQPLEPNAHITIRSGNSWAKADFSGNGVNVRFENPTPEFTTKIGQIVDEFLFSEDKSQETLEQFAIDTFEREKGNGKI